MRCQNVGCVGMTAKIEGFIDRLQRTTSLEGIQSLVTDIRDEFDVDHVVYTVVGTTGEDFGALTYDPEWVDHYVSEKLFRTDPVVQEALKRFHPLDWTTLDWSGKSQKELLGEAVGRRIGPNGLSVPIRGTRGKFAMFSVTSGSEPGQWARFREENMKELLLASHYIHHQAIEVLQGTEEAHGQELSPREKDVLRLLAIGKSRSQASEALQISEHTFRVYVDSARHKLGALNTVHAVSIALTGGHITL